MAVCLIESLQPLDDRVQSREPLVQLLVKPVLGDRRAACRIGCQLLEERCPVRAGLQSDLEHGEQIDSIEGAAERSTHCEDFFDYEVVVLLQGRIVRIAERSGQLLRFVLLGDLQGLARERKAAKEPEQALGRGALLLVLLVFYEQLKRSRL